ncbi:hypothetical protein F8S20_10645 [Nostoc sp. BAE]|nr:hypothetical protein [Nostoc commune BAE]
MTVSGKPLFFISLVLSSGVHTSRITPLNPPLQRGETGNLVPSPLVLGFTPLNPPLQRGETGNPVPSPLQGEG